MLRELRERSRCVHGVQQIRYTRATRHTGRTGLAPPSPELVIHTLQVLRECCAVAEVRLGYLRAQCFANVLQLLHVTGEGDGNANVLLDVARDEPFVSDLWQQRHADIVRVTGFALQCDNWHAHPQGLACRGGARIGPRVEREINESIGW